MRTVPSVVSSFWAVSRTEAPSIASDRTTSRCAEGRPLSATPDVEHPAFHPGGWRLGDVAPVLKAEVAAKFGLAFAPARGVDKLVPDDGVKPRHEGPGIIPPAPHRVHADQHLLDDVFGLVGGRTAPEKTAADNEAKRRRDIAQQPLIRRRVSPTLGAHGLCPSMLVCVHACLFVAAASFAAAHLINIFRQNADHVAVILLRGRGPKRIQLRSIALHTRSLTGSKR